MIKKTFYSKNDLPPQNDPTPPGEFPYVRGIHPTMYLKKHWTMRQYAGFGDAKSSNRRYHYLLSQGITGLSMAFDLPTQMGYDSDHTLAKGEVGRVGVSISSLDDMETVLKDIPLEDVSISMTINATAPILLAFYLAHSDKCKMSRARLRGTLQNDILKEYIARGTYIFPPKPSLKIATDVFEFCKKELPLWNTISVSGYHIREAGSTAVEEVAFTLSNGLCYVNEALKRGLLVDDFLPRVSFFFNVHNDFIEEVSKFRAARSLWAKLIKERFKPKDPKSMMLRFHAQTAGSSLVANSIDTNVVRVTLQCMAAVLGGAQSIHTNSKDEALGLPTEAAATLALRTQQVIAYESGVTQTVDPMGGSYTIESLTHEIERDALTLIELIDKKGGAVQAIEEHFQRNRIQEAAYQYQTEIETKKRNIVGLNIFKEESSAQEILSIDPKIEIEQINRLNQLKQSRNKNKVNESLLTLKKMAQENANLIPHLYNTSMEKATLGEMAGTLAEVFGRYRP